MVTKSWRLIQSPALNGAWNMAVDEAILEATGRGEAPSTLRLYQWNPPCLSLGYAQPTSDVDIARLNTLGWNLVRRPTGGRAILHTDELTYAVIAHQDDPVVTGGVLESYARIAQALLAALNILGIPARADQVYQNQNHEKALPVCFEVPSNYEITVNGKKLIGSAQSRRLNAVLQHGALPLYGDLTRIVDALKYEDEPSRTTSRTRLLNRAVNIEMITGRKISWEEVARALITAFQSSLGLTFVEDTLTESETQRAETLVQEKYGADWWNYRVT
ncbi:MAG TPA: biotin/lipoate A/B protein ligase family protein [Anaerolineaceae bacterium]